MARKRISGTALQTWEDVDAALREIGTIDRDLGRLEAAQNAAIDRVKADTKAKAKPMQDRKAALELAMKEFCEAHRVEFAKAKTKTLTFGSVGFRLSTRVLIKRVGDTLQALKDLGLTHCIRTREEPDKEALKALDTETLASVGAVLKTEDAFGYEINVERLQDAA